MSQILDSKSSKKADGQPWSLASPDGGVLKLGCSLASHAALELDELHPAGECDCEMFMFRSSFLVPTL